MIDLDDPASYAVDASGMFGHIAVLGTELERAWAGAAALPLPASAADATAVVIAAMGGSATAGDYLEALCRGSAMKPIVVVREPALPHWVGRETLVVVCSYSGGTAEALACYDDARRRGAMLLAITTGGELARSAAADGVGVVHIEYSSVPRAAMVHGLGPLLRLANTLRLRQITDAEVAAAGLNHRELVARTVGMEIGGEGNGAKALALRLAGRVPFVIAGEHLAPVARRFKNQLAENAKMFGAAETLPEAAHNLIVGLDGADREKVVVVLLESANQQTSTLGRCSAAFAAECEDAGIDAVRVQLDGGSLLEDMVLGTAWGDYVSCYLAILNGVDPTPITRIERLRGA